MGEYAEMMLDGTCCEACGEYLGFGEGFPAYCSKSCAESRVAYWPAPALKDMKPKPKTKCPECGRRVKVAGLRDHLRDMHGAHND